MSDLSAFGPEIRRRILENGREAARRGTVTRQIPALRERDASTFGIAVATVDGDEVCLGDADESFSLQSISKVFALCALLALEPDDVWTWVGWGPSVDHHDSVAGMDRADRPPNPFVNAGAITVTDRLHALTGGAVDAVQALLRERTGASWRVDTAVAESEAASAHRNRAIAHLLADEQALCADPDEVLAEYFRQCAITGSARDLARAALFLADPGDHVAVLDRMGRRRVNSVLLMSGTYGEAADVSFRIGLPSKSAISGAVVAVAPGKGAIVAWSPPLDDHGNSAGGLAALEEVGGVLGWSIF